ncbi:MAG TPA: glycoside hydrolase family 76 protein [Cyclobacteriaceae bacterium]|nr:glycoside hydrolase family 76 protein [Cyclobacteriaceae bacterium]
MTSKLTIFTIFSLTLILVFSFPQHTWQRQQDSATSIISYTEEDATLAFEAFNKTFYDKELNLYHSTSAREGLGSIWTQAIFWDIIMDSYLRTNRSDYREMIDELYQGAYRRYDGFNYTNTVEWFIYDDIMWWVISLARGYEITGNEEFLQHAVAGFDHVWQGSYDPKEGGMFWDFKHSGKNSCINYPTVIAAMKLYNITENEAYLHKAKEIYSWSRENLYQASTGRVADNRIGNRIGFDDYTYNQGTLIGAAVALYNTTGDDAYLSDAIAAADYTKNVMSDKDGILPAEGDWNEQGVLKAIFGRYLMQLVQEGGQKQYEAWLRKNANLAWHNRDKTRNITFRDYRVPCPTGIVQSFEASSAVGIMQVCPPLSAK